MKRKYQEKKLRAQSANASESGREGRGGEEGSRTLSSTLVGGKLAAVANGSAANLTESASAKLFKKLRNTSWNSDEAMPASMRAATGQNMGKTRM